MDMLLHVDITEDVVMDMLLHVDITADEVVDVLLQWTSLKRWWWI